MKMKSHEAEMQFDLTSMIDIARQDIIILRDVVNADQCTGWGLL